MLEFECAAGAADVRVLMVEPAERKTAHEWALLGLCRRPPDVRRTHFVEPQLLVPTRMQFSTARRRGGRTGSGTSSTTHIQRTNGRATRSSRTFHGGDRVLFLRQFKMTATASGLHVESSRDIRGGLQIKVGGILFGVHVKVSW